VALAVVVARVAMAARVALVTVRVVVVPVDKQAPG